MSTQSIFHSPSTVTKQLKLNVVDGRPKVRVSSNFLPLMDFHPGDRLVTVPSLSGGFTVRKDPEGASQVYKRRYNTRQRGNSPHEALIEFASKSLLSSTFPPSCERFHVKMRRGEVRVTPIPNRVFNIRKMYQGHDPLRALVAMTGGVDVACLAEAGISTEIALEYRPDESRDITAGRSLNEVHALNVLRNGSPRALINEDIYQLDPRTLRGIAEEGNPVAILHYSIQCDDASTAKSASAKAKSIDDLSTTLDQVYPVLRQIEELGDMAPVVMVENVRGFKDSHAGIILRSTLRRWGFHVTDLTLNARDYGSVQNRTRYYMVASQFPGYEAPETQPRKEESIWSMIEPHLADCRDVTDSYAVRSQGTSDRCSTYITPESTFCPTVVKSQDRLIKDGVYIQHGDRVLLPSEGLLKSLMGIPESFDVSWMAREQATETLGQSIDHLMHKAVAESVRDHVLENLGQQPIVKARMQASGDLFA